MSAEIPVSFTAAIRKSPARGGWMYLVWPSSAEHFGTRGLVKVRGDMEGHAFTSSFMPLGNGDHKLPVTAKLAKSMGKAVGDSVRVRIMARL